ncbi:MAG: hypothetical protein HW407_422 [Bacteroidetes bacterium]|nr:hypothetical protein [Bacteroidota bacterium]
MARQQTLDLFIEVRILAGQQVGMRIEDFGICDSGVLQSTITNPKSAISFGLIV